MSILHCRTYKGSEDLQAMIDLIRSLRQNGQVVYPIIADLYEELADPEVQASVCLWESSGHHLVGFVFVSRYNNLLDVFEAEYFMPDQQIELINWAVTATRHRISETGDLVTLDASSLEKDLPRRAFLERHGFECQKESSILMARSLDEPIPDPHLPPGYTIRPMAGEAELDAYVALHRAAFGTENMTVEYRHAIMSVPGYMPELDLVAVAPNGELAAFCMCQIFPDDMTRSGGRREGWTDPMGTHPVYQRQGLAKALMLTGMRLLKARGMDTALLGTASTNIAMRRAAMSGGFRTVSNTLWYSRVVS